MTIDFGPADGADFIDNIGGGLLALVLEDLKARDHIDQRDLIGPKRDGQIGGVGNRDQAEAVGQFGNGGTAHLLGQFDSHSVDGLSQGGLYRDGAAVAAAVVLG